MMDPRIAAYIDWYCDSPNRERSTSFNPSRMRIILEESLVTKKGREDWAALRVGMAKFHLEQCIRIQDTEKVQRRIIDLENLFAVYPEEERFSRPMLELRKVMRGLLELLESRPIFSEDLGLSILDRVLNNDCTY
jgi:hypothetical protein